MTRSVVSLAGEPTQSSTSKPVGIGLIGAGMISGTYLENLNNFPDVKVVIVGDLDAERARSQAHNHGVAAWGSPADVLAHPDVELVVNLTIPKAHVDVASAALTAGKHVWIEKPMGIDRETAHGLLTQARDCGLRVGVAPDTVLGPGLQTSRRAIADGVIGTPLSANTVIQYPGPDMFHPNPDFLFDEGAGPLFDQAPYYLTALVHLLGPLSSVAAVGSTAQSTRQVQVGDRAGQTFPVTVPTHVSVVASFTRGGVAQSVFSFDAPLVRMGVIEITGTEGTMVVPDPNVFAGDVRITRAPTMDKLTEEPEWATIVADGIVAGRGIGVLDMARCIRGGGEHVASAELAYHVLDAMIGIDESIHTGETVRITSAVSTIPLMPRTWNPYKATSAVANLAL